MTTRNSKLNVTPGGAPVVVRVSQYENDSRTIRFKLVGAEEMLSIPSGTTAKVEGTKPSGKGFSYSCTLTGTEVEVVIKDQMTAESGRVPCEVVLRNGTTRLGAGRFELEVEKAGLKAGTITSSDTFDSIIRDEVRKCAEEQLIVLTVDTELSSESSAPVANSTLCNFFAGALKGYASGASVTVDDVSPIEHNPSVRVHGKNFFNYSRMDFENRAGALTDNGNNSVTIKTPEGSSAVSTKATLRQLAPTLKAGKTYILSFVSDGTDKFIYLSITQRGWNNKGVLSVTEKDLESTVFLYASGVNTAANISNIQIEEGTTATAYEPWVDPTTFTVTDGKGNTYTPDADGIVEGVTSTSPTMTLSTDTEGAIIECEYNRDLTAAIERIEAALFN